MAKLHKIDNFIFENNIHIWKTAISNHVEEFNFYWSLLTEEEKKKGNEYYFVDDKNRYVISRGILRVLLSFYTGLYPSDIKLHYSKYGKLSISKTIDKPNICFNLAHSKDTVVYGFTNNALVGIDVEYLDLDFSLKDIELVMSYTSSDKELMQFNGLTDFDKIKYFYRLWVVKEAFVKFVGLGLSFNLSKIRVDFTKNILISRVKCVNEFKYNLTVKFINSYNGYYSAFVTKGNIKNFECYDYQKKDLDFIF